MQHPDDSIDKVLQALGAAEPPSGMNTRLLATLDAARAESHRARRLRPRLSFPRLPTQRAATLGLAAAAVLAISVAPLLLHHNAATHLVPAAPAPVASLQLPRSQPSLAATIPATAHARSTRVSPPARSTNKEPPSTALDNLHATSFPAPPLPLTQQERLLRRIAHTGDPIELAMLDPERRAQGRLLGDQDFQAFFKPSPPPPQPSLVPDPPHDPSHDPPKSPSQELQ